jgi:hypothetical protein
MKVGDIVRLKKTWNSRFHPNIGIITELKGIINRRIGIANFRRGECVNVLMGGKVKTLFIEVLEVVHEAG